MTTEITIELIENETLEELLRSNIHARFDISNEEAARIAERVTSAEEWLETWETECWWTDCRN